MKYCSKCGSENPDDGSFCWKCGAELYSGGTGSFLPDHGKVAEQTVPNPVETKVEASRTVQEANYVDADGRTVLDKTPERILNRRVCLFLSVVTAIAILVATFGFQVNITGLWEGSSSTTMRSPSWTSPRCPHTVSASTRS